MTKSDLKNGMLVELRNGEKYLVHNDGLANSYQWTSLVKYENNLNSKEAMTLDIMKVYNANNYIDFDIRGRTPIWIRPEFETKEVLRKAISTYGLQKQMTKTVEELSELSQALCKSLIRLDSTSNSSLQNDLKQVDNIFEEMADVEIMLAQCKLMFHCADEVAEWKEKKITRLADKLKNGVFDKSEPKAET